MAIREDSCVSSRITTHRPPGYGGDSLPSRDRGQGRPLVRDLIGHPRRRQLRSSRALTLPQEFPVGPPTVVAAGTPSGPTRLQTAPARLPWAGFLWRG